MGFRRPTSPPRRRAVGCRSCEGIGYHGRTAILEVMPVDEAVGRLIDAGAMAEALTAAARRAGMYTLWESELERVWDGTTSLEEVIRVLGERAPEDGTTVTAATPPRGDAGASLRAQVRTACLPVIVLTAQHGETEEKALDLGAHDYLAKPVQSRSLLARVRAVLKRASS
jgi:AmiR/NasT family two-component response regulator